MQRAGAEAEPTEAGWDRDHTAAGGHLLQSWRWGDFKSRHDWEVRRVRVESARGFGLAQILYRRKGFVSVAYIPRGPVLSTSDVGLATELFSAIDHRCRRERAISLVVEGDEPLPYAGKYKAHGFVRGPRPVQPTRTVKVPLLDDDALLRQMHQKTRYNVRQAQRRGVEVAEVEATEAWVDRFYDLLLDTAQRNDFGIHERDYYADFLATFGPDAALLFASVDDKLAAGLIVARCGPEAIYMYGGSSTANRAHGAAFYLQFEAMRWARDRGCRSYDLWGIPADDPPTTRGDDGDRVAPTRGTDWRGLYEFKVRFGGSIVAYPPPLERRYRPVLATVARRVFRPVG